MCVPSMSVVHSPQQNGARHGTGTLAFADGVKFVGQFDHGRPVAGAPSMRQHTTRHMFQAGAVSTRTEPRPTWSFHLSSSDSSRRRAIRWAGRFASSNCSSHNWCLLSHQIALLKIMSHWKQTKDNPVRLCATLRS